MTIAADSDFSSRPRPMSHYVDTELSQFQVPAAPTRQPMLKRGGLHRRRGAATASEQVLRSNGKGDKVASVSEQGLDYAVPPPMPTQGCSSSSCQGTALHPAHP